MRMKFPESFQSEPPEAQSYGTVAGEATGRASLQEEIKFDWSDIKCGQPTHVEGVGWWLDMWLQKSQARLVLET